MARDNFSLDKLFAGFLVLSPLVCNESYLTNRFFKLIICVVIKACECDCYLEALCLAEDIIISEILLRRCVLDINIPLCVHGESPLSREKYHDHKKQNGDAESTHGSQAHYTLV